MTNRNTNPSNTTFRGVLRPFVSSTFNDLQPERDELVKTVFPQLRALCESRFLDWCEVDLRWGITSDESAEGKTLSICFEEIDRCRPYFLGILGGRYGWIPTDLPIDLTTQHPWLHDCSGASVTEMEMVYGAFKAPRHSTNAFFYMLDENRRSELDDAQGSEAHAKLRKLRERIRLSDYPFRDGIRDATELGQLVLADFKQFIDSKFPEQIHEDRLVSYRKAQKSWASSHSITYVTNENTKLLQRETIRNSAPIVLVGESGAGKSSLLAHRMNVDPSATVPAKKSLLSKLTMGLLGRTIGLSSTHFDLEIFHFVESSYESAMIGKMLHSILSILKEKFRLPNEVPEDEVSLQQVLPEWLQSVGKQSRVLIVLDGIDQLQSDDPENISWLPSTFPENVRFIVSTRPGKTLEALKARGWRCTELKKLSVGSGKQLLTTYLNRFGKRLEPSTTQLIGSANIASSPGGLKTIADEIRVFGKFGQDGALLKDLIRHYVDSSNLQELTHKVFDRWLVDYNRFRPSLVEDSMLYLWCSQTGLSESELLDLLGKGRALPHCIWSPFYLAASNALQYRGGTIVIRSPLLASLVEDLARKDKPRLLTARQALIDYFRTRNPHRQADELLWQLLKTEQWPELSEALGRLDFLNSIWASHEFIIKGYLRLLNDRGKISCEDVFRSVIESPTTSLHHSMMIASLLIDMHKLKPAERILKKAMALQHVPICDRRRCLSLQSRLQTYQGKLNDALQTLEAEEQICKRLGDLPSRAACLGNQATINRQFGHLALANQQHEMEELIYREAGDLRGVAISLGNRAVVLMEQQAIETACQLLRDQEVLARQICDSAILSQCLHNQCVVALRQSRLKDACRFADEAIIRFQRIGDDRGLANAWGNKSLASLEQGDFDGALDALDRKQVVLESIVDPHGIACVKLDQAKIFASIGQIEHARTMASQAIQNVSLDQQATIAKHYFDLFRLLQR